MYIDWWNDGVRGGPAWATYHLKVLRRAIERRYPIRPVAVGTPSPGSRWVAREPLRYAAMLPGYFGSVVGFSSAFPDMQSGVAYGGLDILPANVGPNGVYQTIFGSPDSPFAEGNSPQALAANYEHTRVYLTSGNGVNCPEDPPTGSELDSVTEISDQRPAGAVRGRHRGRGRGCDRGDHLWRPHSGVWDRAFGAARAWGFFKPVAERPHRWAYRTVATSGEMWGLRFRFAAPPSRSPSSSARAARLPRRGPVRSESAWAGLPLQRRAAVRAAVATWLPTPPLVEASSGSSEPARPGGPGPRRSAATRAARGRPRRPRRARRTGPGLVTPRSPG